MNIVPDPMLDSALAPQTAPQREPLEPSEQELEAVKLWGQRIKRARDHDAGARQQYAIDRSYIDGSAGRGTFEIRVPIAGTYVGILESFLYTQDPTADCLPAESAGMARMEDARKLAKTMQPLIAQTWRRGKLKRGAKKTVRSGLSIAVGWIKAIWQDSLGVVPLSATRQNDLQDNLQRIATLEAELARGECEYPEAVKAELTELRAGLSELQEPEIKRGMVYDFVPGEDMTIPEEVARTEDCLESPWLAHRIFIPFEESKEKLPRVADVLHRAACYVQVKAKPSNEAVSPGPLAETSAEDADAYRQVPGGGTGIEGTSGGCICVHEIWHRAANRIYTLVEGLDRWGREPYSPDPATERWYSFFRLAYIEVDGRRHPQSLVERSMTQLDEYNRLRCNQREHRRRAIPKSGFDRRTVPKEEAAKLEGGGIGEMIGLNLSGDADPSKAVFPIVYPQYDAALYDTSDVRSELEMIWGIQEALSSSIRTAKTATEAEIQQAGTEGRDSYKRDATEDWLTEIAIYTAEVALQKYTRDEVTALVGPDAFWPRADEHRLKIEDLRMLISIEIRAGSSGKPNTAARRQAWSVLLPQLQSSIMQIGQLRGATPQQIADCLEQLLIETVERTGDRIDATRFIPKAPELPAVVDPLAAGGVPGAPMPGPVPVAAVA